MNRMRNLCHLGQGVQLAWCPAVMLLSGIGARLYNTHRAGVCLPGMPAAEERLHDHPWLLQDLRELEQRHGQSAVVLRMEFKRGLHPFYPARRPPAAPALRGAAAGRAVQPPHAPAAELGPLAPAERPH